MSTAPEESVGLLGSLIDLIVSQLESPPFLMEVLSLSGFSSVTLHTDANSSVQFWTEPDPGSTDARMVRIYEPKLVDDRIVSERITSLVALHPGRPQADIARVLSQTQLRVSLEVRGKWPASRKRKEERLVLPSLPSHSSPD